MSALTSRARIPMAFAGTISPFPISWKSQLRGAGKRSYREGLGNFHLPVFEGVDECFYYGGVEVCSGAGDDYLLGFKRSHGAAIGPVAGQSVEGIGHRQNAGFERDLLAFGGAVSRAVELVVMSPCDGQHAAQRSPDRFEQGNALLDMLAH